MKVRDLLSSPARWTKGVLARNNKGEEVSSSDPEACRWCLVGAVQACYDVYRTENQSYRDVINKIINLTGFPISEYNDTHTFKDIRAVVEELDI